MLSTLRHNDGPPKEPSVKDQIAALQSQQEMLEDHLALLMKNGNCTRGEYHETSTTLATVMKELQDLRKKNQPKYVKPEKKPEISFNIEDSTIPLVDLDVTVEDAGSTSSDDSSSDEKIECPHDELILKISPDARAYHEHYCLQGGSNSSSSEDEELVIETKEEIYYREKFHSFLESIGKSDSIDVFKTVGLTKVEDFADSDIMNLVNDLGWTYDYSQNVMHQARVFLQKRRNQLSQAKSSPVFFPLKPYKGNFWN